MGSRLVLHDDQFFLDPKAMKKIPYYGNSVFCIKIIFSHLFTKQFRTIHPFARYKVRYLKMTFTVGE